MLREPLASKGHVPLYDLSISGDDLVPVRDRDLREFVVELTGRERDVIAGAPCCAKFQFALVSISATVLT